MPVEHLWRWLRQDVTYHTGYEREADLIAQINELASNINATPIEIADRLWITTHLKAQEEKLRVST